MEPHHWYVLVFSCSALVALIAREDEIAIALVATAAFIAGEYAIALIFIVIAAIYCAAGEIIKRLDR